jgi:hypothetical protein
LYVQASMPPKRGSPSAAEIKAAFDIVHPDEKARILNGELSFTCPVCHARRGKWDDIVNHMDTHNLEQLAQLKANVSCHAAAQVSPVVMCYRNLGAHSFTMSTLRKHLRQVHLEPPSGRDQTVLPCGWAGCDLT